MSDIEYSVITIDVIKSFDCISFSELQEINFKFVQANSADPDERPYPGL